MPRRFYSLFLWLGLLLPTSAPYAGEPLSPAFKQRIKFHPHDRAWLPMPNAERLRSISAQDFQLVYDYHFDKQQVQLLPQGLAFVLRPNPSNSSQPLGVRLSSVDAYLAGKLCFKLKQPFYGYPGTILAMYARSMDKEPGECKRGDRWNEMDYEFVGGHPKKVWLNVFSPKLQNGPQRCTDQGQFYAMPALTDSTLFCMQWDARSYSSQPGLAAWFLFDERTRKYTLLRQQLGVITQPMKVKMALWGVSSSWSGYSKFTNRVQLGFKNIQLWLVK